MRTVIWMFCVPDGVQVCLMAAYLCLGYNMCISKCVYFNMQEWFIVMIEPDKPWAQFIYYYHTSVFSAFCRMYIWAIWCFNCHVCAFACNHIASVWVLDLAWWILYTNSCVQVYFIVSVESQSLSIKFPLIYSFIFAKIFVASYKLFNVSVMRTYWYICLKVEIKCRSHVEMFILSSTQRTRPSDKYMSTFS